MKKAQITVFIIIGIIMLLGVILSVVYFKYTSERAVVSIEDKTTKIAAEFLPVKTYTESCIKKVAEDGIIFVGRQGGYFNLPEAYYGTGLGYVTAYYVPELGMPSQEKIEQEIAAYIDANLGDCLRDYRAFKEIGYDVEHDKSETNVTIMKGQVNVYVRKNVKLKLRDVYGEQDSFLEQINFDMKHVIDSVRMLYEEHKKDETKIPISALTNIGLKQGYYYEILYANVDEEANFDVLLDFVFPDKLIRDEPYLFMFAARYKWPTLVGAGFPSSPEIAPIPNLNATVGEFFPPYQIQVTSGENVKFRLMYGIVDVSQSGLITYTPIREHVGRPNPVLIYAETEKGGASYMRFEMNVGGVDITPVFTNIPEGTRCQVNSVCMIRNIKAESPLEIKYFTDMSGITVDEEKGDVTFTPDYPGERSFKIVAMTEDFSAWSYAYVNVTVLDIDQ